MMRIYVDSKMILRIITCYIKVLSSTGDITWELEETRDPSLVRYSDEQNLHSTNVPELENDNQKTYNEAPPSKTEGAHCTIMTNLVKSGSLSRPNGIPKQLSMSQNTTNTLTF